MRTFEVHGTIGWRLAETRLIVGQPFPSGKRFFQRFFGFEILKRVYAMFRLFLRLDVRVRL